MSFIWDLSTSLADMLDLAALSENETTLRPALDFWPTYVEADSELLLDMNFQPRTFLVTWFFCCFFNLDANSQTNTWTIWLKGAVLVVDQPKGMIALLQVANFFLTQKRKKEKDGVVVTCDFVNSENSEPPQQALNREKDEETNTKQKAKAIIIME